MEEGKPSRWQRLQKVSFNRKDLAKRMRKVEGVTIRHARKFIFHRLDNVREVRRHIIMWVMAVGILIGASGLQLMWYQNNYKTTAVADSGTYAEAVLGPISTLNPLYVSTSAERSASALLFSRLFSYDVSGHLNNDLASRLSIDDTGKKYTVKIRSDARWHDGRMVTAKDVVFTVGLLKNPSVRATITGWNDIAVQQVDDTTVTFTIPAIYAAFSHVLASFPILPEHILGKVEPNELRENDFSNSPIGSGPFKLRFVQDIDTESGRRIVHMERNDLYYKGSTKLDRLQLHVYGTQSAILRALASAEVNAAADLTASDVVQVNTQRYQVKTTPIQSGVYALLNTTRGNLKDKTIRQALQIGTDMTAIRDQLPEGTPALDLPFTKDQISGDVPKVPGYDVKAATKILDDAGWRVDGDVRKKDGVELKLSVVTTKDNDYEKVLELLAGQWRGLGIQVDTLVVDPSNAAQGLVQNILQQRNFDVLLYQLTIADPDVYAYWHSSQIGVHGFNFSNYANAISDDALSSARTRLEPSLRNSKYLTFARQWLADIPAIGLYQSTSRYVYSKNVQTYDSSNRFVSPLDRYADVRYWSADQATVFKTP